MAARFLRLADVIDIVGFKRSHIYALVAQGEFPPPVKLGRRASRWVQADIERWVELRIGARGKP